MREVRRRKRLALSAPDSAGAASYPTKITTYRNVWALAPHPDQRRPLSLNRNLSGAFCGTAIDLDGLPSDVPRHLYNFMYGFTLLTFPTTHVHYECGIFSIAVKQGHPALLHALCAVGAVYRALIGNSVYLNGPPVVFEHTDELETAFRAHKQRAIASLRMNLLRQNDHLNTTSIAIAILLLIMETLSGDVTAASIHKSGIVQLTKLCDNASQSLKSLVSDLLMSDIKSATSSLSRPSVSINETWVSELDRLRLLPYVPYRPDLTSQGSGFATVNISQQLGHALTQLMCATRNLINAVEQDFHLGVGVSGIDGVHFLVLEHQLLSLASGEGIKDVLDGGLAECCRIGALLYCNLCLWTWPKNATLVTNLLSYYRAAITNWKPNLEIYEQQTLLLWLYFMGSFGSTRTEDRDWYLSGMRDVSERLSIKTQYEYHCILSKFFYVDRLMKQHLDDCCSVLIFEHVENSRLTV